MGEAAAPSAGGRAGLKRSGYQGGMQSPMIAWWPGHIAPGTMPLHLSAHDDSLATLADLIGGTVPRGKDAISYLPTLLGKPQEQEHEFILVNSNFSKMGRTALIGRDGWKLVEIDRKQDRFQLYYLPDDDEERYDVTEQHPERVSRLKATLLGELDSPRPDL